MKIAIMQPYFFPYIGYFQLINAVNKFIFFDDVNFISRGWINRNRILLNGKDHMVTLPLRQASQNKLINEIEICERNDKILKTIKQAYLKAPHFDETFQLINHVFEKMDETKSIGKISNISVRLVSEYLNLHCIFCASSGNFELTKALHGEERIIAICKEIGANVYINPSGIKGFYDYKKFEENGIKLHYIKNNITPYKQFNNNFIPSLSIIDVMMFNDKEKITTLLNNYELE